MTIFRERLEFAVESTFLTGDSAPTEPAPEDPIQKWNDPVVQALIASLADKEYAVLHGWQTLRDGPTSDVDIVIAEADLPALELALLRECGATIAQIIRYEGGCGFFFLAVSNLGGEPRFTQIDAATSYSRDGRILLDGQELLKGRWNSDGIWVVSPEAEFAYLLIKKICKRHFPAHQRARLAELTQRLGNDAVRIVEDVLGIPGAADLVASIEGSDWSAIEPRLEQLHRQLLYKAAKRHHWNSFRYWSAELRRGLWRWCNPTGLMLVIMGPDGSGKSTLIEHLKNKARPLFWWEAALFHFRPDVWGTTKDRGPVVEPHGKANRNALGSAFKLGYYAADFAVGYLRTIRPGLIRSRLMIFDRYYHDLFVDKRRYRYSGPMFLARMVSHLIPTPDMFLIVDAPEDIIHERKQELPLDELRRQRIAYRNLAATLPNAVLLNGTDPPAEIARKAHRDIIDRMVVRYNRRRRAWFKDDRGETLRWLSHALSHGDDDLISASGSGNERTEPFYWLQMPDGRGYLLPADSKPAALVGLGLYHPQRLKSRVAKSALGIAIRAGMAPLVFSRVYAARPKPIGPVSRVFDYLTTLMEKPLRFAISLGTPGPHRKPVIQLMDESGCPIAFAKIGWNTATSTLVRNEANTYRRLSRLKFKCFSHPNLIHGSRWGSHFISVQSGPAAAANAPLSTELYLGAVTELSKVGFICQRFSESGFGKELQRRIEADAPGHRTWLVREALEASLGILDERAIPFHLAHGDLAPWNACMTGGTLFLFDWEYSRWQAPAGWDLFHFFLQTNSLLGRRSPIQIIKRFEEFKTSIKDYVRHLALSDELLTPLFLLYLADQLVTCGAEYQRNLERLHLLSSIASLLALQCQEKAGRGITSRAAMEGVS